MKKLLGSLWIVREVCIQTLQHMLKSSCKHYKKSLDFEIGVVVHTMHTNHDSRCNVLLFQFWCHTYSDVLKYIHLIAKGKTILQIINSVSLSVSQSVSRGPETHTIFNKTVPLNSRAQKLFRTSSSYFLLLLLCPFPRSNCRRRWGRYFWDFEGG